MDYFVANGLLSLVYSFTRLLVYLESCIFNGTFSCLSCIFIRYVCNDTYGSLQTEMQQKAVISNISLQDKAVAAQVI
jgi:uncharacterized SAM-binding protein YcdF (DUF218 family)